jgi:hypothetical protein
MAHYYIGEAAAVEISLDAWIAIRESASYLIRKVPLRWSTICSYRLQ